MKYQLVFLLFFNVFSFGDCEGSPSTRETMIPKRILILDVDNTLYNEKALQRKTSNQGIELQIIENTHTFCQKQFQLSKQQSDALYKEYGSTIEGIRSRILEGQLALHSDSDTLSSVLKDYYDYVYHNIDMKGLSIVQNENMGPKTGYNPITSAYRRSAIRNLLQFSPYPIYLASNSPLNHVHKVLMNLGLQDISYAGIITPDSFQGQQNHESVTYMPYPTKLYPHDFYKCILEKYNPKDCDIFLIDDSLKNIERAESVGMKGIHIHSDANENAKSLTLDEALAIAFGHVESVHNHHLNVDVEDVYTFSDVNYLQSKNVVDKEAMDNDLWNEMIYELVKNVKNSHDTSDAIQGKNGVRIVDVGAGLLSILTLMLNGEEGHASGGKMSLLTLMRHEGISSMEYMAYESNRNLIPTCLNTLNDLGFHVVSTAQYDDSTSCDDDTTTTYVFEMVSDVSIRVVLRVKDFSEDVIPHDQKPHLIVGCCFADLFDPEVLISALLRFSGITSQGGGTRLSTKMIHDNILLYFPITFAGITQFHKPKPFGSHADNNAVPSDTLAFQLYSTSLLHQQGHNIYPDKIVSSMRDAGIQLISSASSVWNIDPVEHNYLWRTMMYFFGTTVGPEFMKLGWNCFGWLERARKHDPHIRVMNKDLLFLLSHSTEPHVTEGSVSLSSHSPSDQMLVEEIEFQSPNCVGISPKSWSMIDQDHIGPDQVEIKAVYSLISTGTELKIFKGLFDEAALDVNIKGMTDQSMKYPLSYGYSLVGVVTRCGAYVKDAKDLIGKMVFTFSHHASHVVADRDAVHLVPDGISPKDAIFMPSVETAVSIVHDANIRLGENVAIYGQGIIGLLVNGILSLSKPTMRFSASSCIGKLTVFDTVPNRLGMASFMGANEALLPSESKEAGPFDVSIEVSGNARALQSAIDNTRNGGKVIIGSWYGNSMVALRLDIDFHRSHKMIKASQVSTIPAELSSTWSKSRRFDLTWELVRLLKPSRLITKIVTLNKAQEAYEALDISKEIAVAFEYK